MIPKIAPNNTNGGAVLEQALALDAYAQPSRNTERLKDHNHGDGIGGGHENGEHQAVDEPEILDEVQSSPTP
jgi:hypothetical protein